MSYPSELKYTKEHEWIKLEADGTYTVGITSYALDQLGDVVFLELPDENTDFEAGDSFGTIESTKTVSDLYMPTSGKILSINGDIAENLEALSEDPYEEGWLVKIKPDSETSDLLSAEEYESFISEID